MSYQYCSAAASDGRGRIRRQQQSKVVLGDVTYFTQLTIKDALVRICQGCCVTPSAIIPAVIMDRCPSPTVVFFRRTVIQQSIRRTNQQFLQQYTHPDEGGGSRGSRRGRRRWGRRRERRSRTTDATRNKHEGDGKNKHISQPVREHTIMHLSKWKGESSRERRRGRVNMRRTRGTTRRRKMNRGASRYVFSVSFSSKKEAEEPGPQE